jgi:hypothetical protein
MSILHENRLVAPKHDHFHEVEEHAVQFVRTQRQNGIPVSCNNIKIGTREVAKMLPVNTAYQELKAKMLPVNPVRPVQNGVYE